MDAWHRSIREDGFLGSRTEIARRLVELGEPGLHALVERLAANSRDVEFVAEAAAVLPHFGVAAVRPVAVLIARDDARLRALSVEILRSMAGLWATDDSGPDVCRALVQQLDGECERDAVLATLKLSRPAGRAVAEDLARRWIRGGDDAEGLDDVLLAFGPDAAPAARTLLSGLGDEDGERRGTAVWLLAHIGPAEPSLLPDLRRMLDGPPQARRDAVGILSAWGDAAASAAPRLIELLSDPHGLTQIRAARALAAMPASWDIAWPAVRSWLSLNAGSQWGSHVTAALAARPDVARRLTADLPSLTADAIGPVHDALWEEAVRRDDFAALRAVAPALLAHAAPEARRRALRPWEDGDPAHPLPDGALGLLGDPDARVRAAAANLFASLHAAPASRLFEVATALLTSGDPAVRAEAAAALGVLSQDGDAKALDLAIAGLADDAPEVRLAVRGVLAARDAPIAGEHPEAVAALARDYIEGRAGEMERIGDLLLRFDGGGAALAAAVTKVLEGGPDAGWLRFSCALDTVVAAGPRLAALRPLLVQLRGSVEEHVRSDVQRAIASIDEDAAVLVETSDAYEATIRRLLALGAPGRLSAVRAAGRAHASDDVVLGWFEGAPMAEAIAVSVAPAAPDEPADAADERQIGAARLAPLLPPARAVEVLLPLAAGEADAPRRRALESLTAIEATSPGAVPAGVVAARLATDDVASVVLAGRLGARGAQLVGRLRELRDSPASAADLRAAAAVALWRITRREDETLPALRALLARPERLDRCLPWADVASVLRDARTGPDDAAAVIASLRYAATFDNELGEHQFSDSAPASLGGPMAHSLAALAGVVEALGPAASSAVPALRVALGRSLDDAHRDPCPGEAVARALAAIGPAARDALHDLRRYAASTKDPRGVVAEAIRRIEATPR